MKKFEIKMSKEVFVDTIKELQELDEATDGLNKELKKLDADFNYISFGEHMDLIMKLLRIAMNDEECDWIGYYIYERDYGKKMKLGDIEYEGKKLNINTSAKLYDFLLNYK